MSDQGTKEDPRLIRLRLTIGRLDAAILTMLSVLQKPDQKPEQLQMAQQEIARLWSDRDKVVLAIGRIKQELGLPIYHPDVEREKIERLQTIAKEIHLNISPEGIKKLFLCIFAQSREMQEARR